MKAQEAPNTALTQLGRGRHLTKLDSDNQLHPAVWQGSTVPCLQA